MKPLNSKENIIMAFTHEGLSNYAIGTKIHLKEETVRKYHQEIYKKLYDNRDDYPSLDVNRRCHAVRLWLERQNNEN